MKLNKQDIDILKALQDNAWLSNEEIGNRIGRDASIVSRRVAAIKEAKVITGALAALDPQKIGLVTTVFTLVALKQHGGGLTTSFEEAIDLMPHIVEWSRIGGSWDYLLKTKG